MKIRHREREEAFVWPFTLHVMDKNLRDGCSQNTSCCCLDRLKNRHASEYSLKLLTIHEIFECGGKKEEGSGPMSHTMTKSSRLQESRHLALAMKSPSTFFSVLPCMMVISYGGHLSAGGGVAAPLVASASTIRGGPDGAFGSVGYMSGAKNPAQLRP